MYDKYSASDSGAEKILEAVCVPDMAKCETKFRKCETANLYIHSRVHTHTHTHTLVKVY
jgi:hypothetical protein